MAENMNVSGYAHKIGSLISRSAGEAGPSGVKGLGKSSDFSRIEELIKGNTFSREEICRLLEILNSRVELESEKNMESPRAGVDGRQVPFMHEILRTPVVERQQHPERVMVGTLLDKRDVSAGVGASPIDIARAFMAARSSKGEITQTSNDFAQNRLMQSPSAKSSTCWPGAMVLDHRGYTTPQSQRGRYGLRDFPRTPYSRTNLSKSTAKVQAESRFTNTSTPFQQSQTSIFEQASLRGETVNGTGSVGPIRRIRNKFATEVRPRGSFFLNSPKDSSRMVKSNVLSGLLPSTENNLEPGETSGASKNWSTANVSGSSHEGFRDPSSSSSQAVKKILEHLDRNKPTPKQKQEELKLATAWRNSSAPGITPGTSNITLLHFGEPSSSKSTSIAGSEFPAEATKSGSYYDASVKFHGQSVDKANDASINNAKASGSSFGDSSRAPGSNAIPVFGFGYSAPTVNNSHENSNNGPKESSLNFACHMSNGPDAKSEVGADLSKNHGRKPSLPSISISSSPYPRADNGPAGSFSFPISASAGVLSEPPTPSILPSSSTMSILPPQPQPQGLPSYSFGTNKSTPRLVFSFPSTSSNASISGEASDLTFTFGSDEKSRLSFSSFGKDSICF